MKFRYSISRNPGNGGRHYVGEAIEGYGNELLIDGREKSISRLTAELALKNALEIQAKEGRVSGPRKLAFREPKAIFMQCYKGLGLLIIVNKHNQNA